MEEFDIAIIGGGPAGIASAIATSKDLNVVLLEKNSSLGCKLLITGGGKCNITNNKPIKKLLNSFHNKNFLKHSFYTFTNEMLLDLFKNKGLEFIVEDNGRVFPETENSRDILAILKDYLNDITIKYNYEVLNIKKEDNFIINNEIIAKKVIIATGGVTYPKTGSAGDGYSLTNTPVTDIKYGLVPLITKKDLSDIAGITLYDVILKYNNFKTQGNVLISHVGLTGPGILNISSEISENLNYNILENSDVNFNEVLAIDLCPNFNQEELKAKFTNDFQDKGKTYLKNYLKYFLTNNFIPFFLESVNIDGETQVSRINKKQKNKLIEALKNFKFEIVGFNKDLSHVTLGGVAIEQINPKTMESTITKDLYFAGEVLEPAGPTGGYNLKIAFSTGYLAGLSASKNNL